MYSFRRISPSDKDWTLIESCYDSSVFHSRKWSQYLSKTLFKPFIAEVIDSNKTIGYFIGTRFGLGFHNIAAPMEGAGTYTQGLCFIQHVSTEDRLQIYKEFADWVFNNKFASLLQVDDWNLRIDNPSWINPNTIPIPSIFEIMVGGANISYRPTLYVDLYQSEQELWSNLSYKSCKYCINKARKKGLRINVIDHFNDIGRFSCNHYRQIVDVCKRHGTHPKHSQSQSRILKLCESLFPDKILMIEVIGLDESEKQQIMSSGIFCYDKGESIYFTGASEQKYMKYCPNELMVWEAMRILHNRGAGSLNFGGMASYKLKFGTKYAFVPRLFFYKHPIFYSTKVSLFKGYHFLRNFFSRK